MTITSTVQISNHHKLLKSVCIPCTWLAKLASKVSLLHAKTTPFCRYAPPIAILVTWEINSGWILILPSLPACKRPVYSYPSSRPRLWQRGESFSWKALNNFHQASIGRWLVARNEIHSPTLAENICKVVYYTHTYDCAMAFVKVTSDLGQEYTCFLATRALWCLGELI